MDECSYATVATWVLDKGFGFIHPDNGDRAVFCHVNQCWNREPLERGWRVGYQAEDRGRGPRVTWIEVVS